MQHPALARGIVLSVSASILFALLSGYTRLLTPLTGLEIFAWRVIWTLPGIVVLIVWRRHGPQVGALAPCGSTGRSGWRCSADGRA